MRIPFYGDPIGNFGTAYSYRTMVAMRGLGANTTDIVIYPKVDTDKGQKDHKIAYRTFRSAWF